MSKSCAKPGACEICLYIHAQSCATRDGPAAGRRTLAIESRLAKKCYRLQRAKSYFATMVCPRSQTTNAYRLQIFESQCDRGIGDYDHMQ
jgi:hypothetical protein